MEVDDDLYALSSEQRRELAAAVLSESDHDLAFKLQMEEALNASLASQPSSSNSKRQRFDVPDQGDVGIAKLLAIDKFGREWIDNKRYESVKISSENFRVYCKGLVGEETVGSEKKVLAGIGVAICDSSGEIVVFTKRMPLVFEKMSGEIAEVQALIEGLNAAVTLGLKRITVFCDDTEIYQFVTRRWSSKQDQMASLLSKIENLRKNFTECRPSFVARNAVKYAYKLAREAIISQTNQAESSGTKIESCVICLEDVDVCQIFSVDSCMHCYCFSCMKQHVKVKLLNALLPKCPHDGCPSVLKLDSCQRFLTPKWIDIMRERLTEAEIPVTEKIYCPYPKCSALMSRTGILKYTEALYPDVHECGVRKCIKCHGLFCVSCKVPWHNNMTCYVFKKKNINQHAEDVKLKTLAAQNRWRQCVKCSHMIEIAKGCYHMTCRCGYEFCYTCGSEWKNKKATCTCPLWDDDLILDYED